MKLFGTGFERRERLFARSPAESVYSFAEAALGGIRPDTLRFGGMVARTVVCVLAEKVAEKVTAEVA